MIQSYNLSLASLVMPNRVSALTSWCQSVIIGTDIFSPFLHLWYNLIIRPSRALWCQTGDQHYTSWCQSMIIGTDISFPFRHLWYNLTIRPSASLVMPNCDHRVVFYIPPSHMHDIFLYSDHGLSSHHSASLVMPKGDPRDGFFYHDIHFILFNLSISWTFCFI